MSNLKIPDRYLNLAFHWTGPGHGSQPVTTLGVLLQDAGDPADVSTDIAAIMDALTKPMSVDYSITSLVVTVGNDTGPPYLTQENTVISIGNSTLAAAPPNCAALVTKNTATPGRQGRGRMFLPGVVEAAIGEDGTIDTTSVMYDQLQELCDTLTAWTSSGDGIESFALFHPIDSALPNPSTIGSFVLQTMTATQRRRLRR